MLDPDSGEPLGISLWPQNVDLTGLNLEVRRGNDRFRLDDAVMVKDNHVAAAGGIRAAVEASNCRHVLITHGTDSMKATAEALAWGWEHLDRLRTMENPAGYLYRVGYRRGIRQRRKPIWPTGPR